MRVMVINGPNLNKLGSRDATQYGTKTYDNLKSMIVDKAMFGGFNVELYQSNYEGGIIDCIQKCDEGGFDGIVINPGAYSHYSYAIMDAIGDCKIPVVEVHISDVTNREDFRKILITSKECDYMISGKGFEGYLEAIDYILKEKQ